MEVEIQEGIVVATAIIAGVMEVIPPLKQWFENTFEPYQKQIIMFLLPLILSVVTLAIGCVSPDSGLTCPEGGLQMLWQVAVNTALAWFAGQATHHGTDKLVGKP